MNAIAKFQKRYRAETAELGLIDWDRLPPAAAEWANAMRRRAHLSVMETGMPTSKLERWKYTNLPAKLKKMNLKYQDADITLSGARECAEVFAKGLLHFPQWAQDMVEADAPSIDKYGDMILWHLADAYLKDGFALDVPANTQNDQALQVAITGRESAYFMLRQVIRVGKNASFTYVEHQTGAGAYWGNIVTQIHLAKGAKFKHYRFQENSDTSVVTQNTHIVMEEGAEYEAFTLTTGAGLSRNQIHADLNGANVICKLNGVTMMDGDKLSDTTITVDHKAPNCNSYQDYRTVVSDKATGVFQGKVHVHKIAQKTDGYQMAKSLLLSPQATINTKPELEIYADDVKCSHGATTGKLDDEALFYLRSRGIPEASAKNLLIQAFVNEVIENISNDEVRAQAENIVSGWLMGQG